MALVGVLIATLAVALFALVWNVSQRPRVQRARWIAAGKVAASSSTAGAAPAAKPPRKKKHEKKKTKRHKKGDTESDQVMLVADKDAAGREQEDEEGGAPDEELGEAWHDELDEPTDQRPPPEGLEVVEAEKEAKSKGPPGRAPNVLAPSWQDSLD